MCRRGSQRAKIPASCLTRGATAPNSKGGSGAKKDCSGLISPSASDEDASHWYTLSVEGSLDWLRANRRQYSSYQRQSPEPEPPRGVAVNQPSLQTRCGRSGQLCRVNLADRNRFVTTNCSTELQFMSCTHKLAPANARAKRACLKRIRETGRNCVCLNCFSAWMKNVPDVEIVKFAALECRIQVIPNCQARVGHFVNFTRAELQNQVP